MMLQVGIAGSLMSLGAIDFGIIVDSSVIMVENSVRHLARAHPGRTATDVVAMPPSRSASRRCSVN